MAWPFARRVQQRTTTRGLTKKQELENTKIDREIGKEKRDKEIDEKLHSELLNQLDGNNELWNDLIRSRWNIALTPKKSVDDRIAEEELLKDPEYREAVKKARIAALQPKGAARAKLEERVSERAEQLMSEDKELLDKVAKKQLEQIVSGVTDNPFGTFLSQYKDFKGMMGELEGEKPADGDHFWGDVVGGLVKALPDVLPFLVGRGGEVPRARQLPVGQGAAVETAPQPLVVQVPPRPPKPLTTDLQEPPSLAKDKTLNISSWLVYLEKEPEAFVEALASQIELEDEGAAVAVKILLQYKTADELFGFLSLFESKMPLEAKEAVAKLKENKEWVESVMRLVKERFGKEKE